MSDKVVYYDKEDIEMNSEFDEKRSITSTDVSTNYILDTHGIKPVLSNTNSIQKNNYPFFTSFILWFASNSSVPILSMGTLGPVLFGLSFKTCVILIILSNFFCSIPVAYFATFGKTFGLRQLIL